VPEWPKEDGSRVAYGNDTEEKTSEEEPEEDMPEAEVWVGDDLDSEEYGDIEVLEDGTRVAGEWVGVDFETPPQVATEGHPTATTLDHEVKIPVQKRTPLRLVVNNLKLDATSGEQPIQPHVAETTPRDLTPLESTLIEGDHLWRLEWQWSSKNRQSLRRRRFIRVDSKWVKDTGPGSVVYIRYFDHATAEAIKKRGSNVIKKLVEAFLADRLRRNA
jgi:hypothetical protein